MAVLETVMRNAMADAIDTQINSGTAATLVFETSGDVEVATLTFGDPAFGAAATGVITANSITDDTSATGGTVAQASIYADAAKQMEMTVATSGAESNMSSLVVAASETVSCSALTITVPAS